MHVDMKLRKDGWVVPGEGRVFDEADEEGETKGGRGRGKEKEMRRNDDILQEDVACYEEGREGGREGGREAGRVKDRVDE